MPQWAIGPCACRMWAHRAIMLWLQLATTVACGPRPLWAVWALRQLLWARRALNVAWAIMAAATMVMLVKY